MNIRLYYINFIFLALLLMGSGCVKKQTTNEEMKKEYYSMEDFNRVRKIDTHAHINTQGKTMINEAREKNFRLMVMAVDVVPEYPPMEEQLRVRIKHFQEDPDVFTFSTAFTLEDWDEPDWSEKVIAQLKSDFNMVPLV